MRPLDMRDRLPICPPPGGPECSSLRSQRGARLGQSPPATLTFGALSVQGHFALRVIPHAKCPRVWETILDGRFYGFSTNGNESPGPNVPKSRGDESTPKCSERGVVRRIDRSPLVEHDSSTMVCFRVDIEWRNRRHGCDRVAKFRLGTSCFPIDARSMRETTEPKPIAFLECGPRRRMSSFLAESDAAWQGRARRAKSGCDCERSDDFRRERRKSHSTCSADVDRVIRGRARKTSREDGVL